MRQGVSLEQVPRSVQQRDRQRLEQRALFRGITPERCSPVEPGQPQHVGIAGHRPSVSIRWSQPYDVMITGGGGHDGRPWPGAAAAGRAGAR